jgi:hypothetical protein
MSDGAAYLWRLELAGQPRDADLWRALHRYANGALPHRGSGLADLHVILAQAVAGDDTGIEARAKEMEAPARDGRYPSGSYPPTLARGFAAFERADFAEAIAVLTPLAGRSERIGGTRAQHDLIEFTLLKACLNAGHLEEARRLLSARRLAFAALPSRDSPRCIDHYVGWRRTRSTFAVAAGPGHSSASHWGSGSSR